jgi:hypothetical protein
VIVPRADRPELVAALQREGLTQQQIGEILGLSAQVTKPRKSTSAPCAGLADDSASGSMSAAHAPESRQVV